MGNEVSTKTLLIGCGGSGIKTLLRLNELMSSNGDVRKDMAENISYFVLDTDAGDLDDFEKMIKIQMGFDTPPTVRKAHLTGGYHFLNEMVSPNFDKKPEEVTSLMKKYWWYNEDGVPFRGEDIKDLQAGAAQCCQVSYLATWNYMSKIETTIKSMLQEIRSKNKTQANPLAKLKVYIVAGIAGGTGRGSWTLVAFKVRECLLREGVNVPIDGVFFDATCYPNVTGDAEQRENMFVNSATAISELSSWIRLKKDQNSEYFTLPSLSNPLNADAINFKKYLTAAGSQDVAPIQSAYVVFGGNGATAHLLDNMQYHNMAAAAIYAMIVNAQNTDQKNSNKRSNIGSFASATFEVDSIRIQTYLETLAQKTFLAEQSAEASPEITAQANEALGSVQSPAKESFLGKNQLWIPAELTFDGSFSSMNTETSLLEAIMAAIAKKADNLTLTENDETKTKELKLTAQLREALDSQDVDTVKGAVETLFLLEGELDDTAIKTIIANILAERKLDEANLAATLRNLVMEQFAPDGEQVSLRRAMLFADGLFQAFTQYSQSLKSFVAVGGNQYDSVAKLIEAFQTDVVSKSGKTAKEVILFGKPFNKDEIEELCQKFQYFTSAAVFFRIREELESFFKAALKNLESIRTSLDKMSECLKEASKKLNGNVTKVFNDTPFDDIFDELFTNSEDQEAIKKSIPQANDLKSLYYRNLKPILSRAELKALLLAKDSIYVENKPIMTCIQKELDNLLDVVCKVKDRRYDTEDDANDVIPEKIKEAVMANVALNPDPSGRSFTNQHFSFEAVLKKNREAWNNLLKGTPQTRLNALTDQLREYVGLDESDYEKNKNGIPSRIGEDILVQKMVLSLVTVCNPWIELASDRASDEKQPLTCLVVLPIDISEYEAKLKEMIETVYSNLNYNLSLEILHKGSKTAKTIPQDRILVYNSELLSTVDNNGVVDGAPIHKILSMEYWKDYTELLELAEDQNHDSSALFTKDARYGSWVEKPRSFAYLAPFFTMDPFKKLRWHPWIKEDVDKERERLEEVFKVLFYAFLGHDASESEPVAAREIAKGFTLPLLNMGKRGNHAQSFSFLREPLEWASEKGQMVSALETPWNVDEELENSIDNVIAFLNEQGRAGDQNEGGKRLQVSIQEGAKIRLALMKEAEIFFEKVPGSLGDSYKDMVRKCCQWLNKKFEDCSASEAEDKKFWKELFNFAKSELNKLG